MSNLITPAEFATYRDISKKIDEAKVNECISLAQQSDLMSKLGDFYFDVVKNAEEVSWSELMSGCEFSYNGYDYEHKGIKALLADYTYSRFIYGINVNLTPFGAQQKYTQDSQGVDRNVLKDLAKQAQIDAGLKFKYIEYYILSRPDQFSRYCSENKPNTNFTRNKYTAI